ncbi:MAG: 5'/3'-nucleotidase SurE [Spirochaetes bacterium]|nr:5'/3'-nucleotidase SurE [Spirochaetota bacterium]
MKILLTNDDGVHAKGINVLYEILREEHEVYIVAPHEEKSGCSNAFTLKHNLKIKKFSDKVFSVRGFTADCVNIGLRGGLIPETDLIISGINHGPNLGDDIYFSGTVGGARSAYIFGKSGIAVSVNCHGESDFFADASTFLLNYLRDSQLFNNNSRVFLNINYPDLPADKIKGSRYSTLGRRLYNDEYKIVTDNGSDMDLQFTPGMTASHHLNTNDSDITNIEKGYITITPLTLNSTDFEQLNALK